MMVFRRSNPPPVFSRPFFPVAVMGMACLTGLAWPALAQTSSALQAADPASPSQTLPLVLPATTAATPQERPADLARAREIWQRANQRVAEFPRGHVDLLRWEASNPADTAAKAPTQSVAGATGAAPLDMAQALRLSLRHRPDLFTHADMNPMARAQLQVAYARHVRELQRAWIDAVVARQSWRHASEQWDATRTGSELGQRMVVAGNWSQARLTREQLVEAAAWQASVNAQGDALAAQERLAGLLGVWEAAAVAQLGERLPAGLPEVPLRVTPGSGIDAGSLEAAVLQADPVLTLQQAQTQRDLAGVAPADRQAWRAAMDAAIESLPEPGRAPTPPHIANLSLLGKHALQNVVTAEAGLLRAAAERRSMARQAWTHLQSRHASAVHAQNVVAQLQSALEQETLLRYNGMLQSSWELLASARERMRSLDAALLARRDFWRAQADWQALLSGTEYAGTDTPSSSGAAANNAAAGH